MKEDKIQEIINVYLHIIKTHDEAYICDVSVYQLLTFIQNTDGAISYIKRNADLYKYITDKCMEYVSTRQLNTNVKLYNACMDTLHVLGLL
jgi:hypothetical protein